MEAELQETKQMSYLGWSVQKNAACIWQYGAIAAAVLDC